MTIKETIETSIFIPGLRLSQRYYGEIIKPILDREFPRLRYSAGLIGTGSEVIGQDTPQSMDHNWGLRATIFLTEKDFQIKSESIDSTLRRSLPMNFLGFPTSFAEPDERGVRLPDPKIKHGEVNHYISIFTIRRFFEKTIGLDPFKNIKLRAWLPLPQQKLLEITGGRMFHDDLRMRSVVEKFRYFPRDVWLYLLAAKWSRISEEESFVARTSSVGDELGSRIIATRIVNELIKLSFLLEKTYTPYSKWIGKAFFNLKMARRLKPALVKVLEADTIEDREKSLSRAYQIVASKTNSLSITKSPISTRVSNYFGRPYLIIHGDRFAREIQKQIHDPRIRILLLIGSIDQLTGETDILTNEQRLGQFLALYESLDA